MNKGKEGKKGEREGNTQEFHSHSQFSRELEKICRRSLMRRIKLIEPFLQFSRSWFGCELG